MKLRDCENCGQDAEQTYPVNGEMYCASCRDEFERCEFTPREQFTAAVIAVGLVVLAGVALYWSLG